MDSLAFSIPNNASLAYLGPVRAAEDVEVPYLDAQATTSQNETFVSLVVVNRHRDEEIVADIEIEGANGIRREGGIFEINGKSPDVENSFIEPSNVGIVERRASNFGNKFRYKFPAHSVTLLRLRTAQG